jgi:enoyl-CoA hydratase
MALSFQAMIRWSFLVIRPFRPQRRILLYELTVTDSLANAIHTEKWNPAMAIKLTFEERLSIITLKRPEALNALSFSIMKELDQALVEVDKSVARALIITGAGEKAFSAGADVMELRGRTMAQQQHSTVFGQAVLSKLETLNMPSLALINGYAFGGGLELAMACTFRLATPNAKMGLPEIKLGLIPGYGGTQRLPRLVGQGRAMELILSGRTVDAQEAERIGLVNHVVAEEPMSAAREFLTPMLEYSQAALNLARSAVSRAMDQPLDAGLKVEADLSTLVFQTNDSDEGMAAFVEKRAAQFNDD